MVLETLNIIHLDKNKDRRISFMKQILEHKITASVWPGVISDFPFTGISKAYKQVVKQAKELNLPYVIIADDDFNLTCPNAWNLFLSDMPSDFDLYFGGISGGEIGIATENENVCTVSNFSGTFLFVVHNRFYDVFLSADETKHIDRWLGLNGLQSIENQLGRNPIYKVRYPIVCTCIDGISDNSGKFMEHQKYFLPYQIQN